MAVYKRTYRGYSGSLTPGWSRFLVLPRFSVAGLFQSKFLLIFMVASFFYPVGCAGFIYLSHNLSFLRGFNISVGKLLTVDSHFFAAFMIVQGSFAYIMTAFVGPSLVAPDLANNALPLYFCRPFSRTEYVLGKMSVLLYLLSRITWIPGLVLFAIQGSLEGWEWTKSNLWMAWAVFAGLALWIAILSLIALALSAWVKWRIAAGALVLGVYFAGGGFGAAINAVMRTDNGRLIDLSQVIYAIWAKLLRLDPAPITATAASMSLIVMCLVCLWLLVKKVKAFEVVK